MYNSPFLYKEPVKLTFPAVIPVALITPKVAFVAFTSLAFKAPVVIPVTFALATVRFVRFTSAILAEPAVMAPVTLMSPETSREYAGSVVPIPKFPCV